MTAGVLGNVILENGLWKRAQQVGSPWKKPKAVQSDLCEALPLKKGMHTAPHLWGKHLLKKKVKEYIFINVEKIIYKG